MSEDYVNGEHGYEFISISWSGSSISGKTQKYEVRANRDYATLGQIYWFGRWRQYVFMPLDTTVYSVGCLADIQEFLDICNKTHRLKNMQDDKTI